MTQCDPPLKNPGYAHALNDHYSNSTQVLHRIMQDLYTDMVIFYTCFQYQGVSVFHKG